MPRTRALAVVVILVSYGALGARQPAVRSNVALPAPAESFAKALNLASVNRSQLVLDVVRHVFDAPDGLDPDDLRLRARLNELLRPGTPLGETVPLPLDPSIWRDTLLQRQVPDEGLMAAVLSDRRTALLYHGLSALDDETLGWLGPDRETLQDLLLHAGTFAAFGRSIRIKAGRVVVPGGSDAEPLWEALVGAAPDRPAPFVRRLMSGSRGRLALLYDTVSHFDEARQRLVFGATLPDNSRTDRVRALLDVFVRASGEWTPDIRPFARPPFDPSLTVALLQATSDGRLVGPSLRSTWERVFRDDDSLEVFLDRPVASSSDAATTRVDVAWLTARVHVPGIGLGRRRLDTLLFAQRVFADTDESALFVVPTLRAMSFYPALMLTLERAGVTSGATMAACGRRAHALDGLRDADYRRTATQQFQAVVGILERSVRTGGLSSTDAGAHLAAVCALPLTSRGYDGKLGEWVRAQLIPALPSDGGEEDPRTAEDAVLAGMAGIRVERSNPSALEWEGSRYVVDAARAELLRLRRVREQQHGDSLDVSLEALAAGPSGSALAREERRLAETLTSILYAAHIGYPEGAALRGGNVALRHDLGLESAGRAPIGPWRLPREHHGRSGWWISGSLLGLESAMARLALRRLDSTTMPPEPRLTTNERQTAFLSVALLQPAALTDASRDEIAAALGRGRARLAALTSDGDDVDRVARDAGLSEWRRQALAWIVANDREQLMSQLSLVELFWLGAPRMPSREALDAWGAAMLPLTGCLCLRMPPRAPWEHLAGRPAYGILATAGADVNLRVAEALAALDLPATLAPGVVAYAMQEVIDQSQPSYFDDWFEFSRTVMALPNTRLEDYIAALTAGGPLLPAPASNGRRP